MAPLFCCFLFFKKIWMNSVTVGISKIIHRKTYLPLSPPHLCLHPPRHSPDLSVVRLLPLVHLLHLSLPPRGQSEWSGRSAAAGEAVFCCHLDWMIGKPQSPLWPTQAPNRDGIPAYDGPLSRSAWLESREPRCLALPFSWERERLVHCGGLKLYEINSRLLLLKSHVYTKTMVVL